jgi:hypothetical protein
VTGSARSPLARSPLTGSVRALAAWWRARGDLLPDSALAGAMTAGYAALAIALAVRHSPERPIDWFTFYLLLVVCWGAGSWVRARHPSGP